MSNRKDYSTKQILEITGNVTKELEKVENRNWGIEGTFIELTKQVGTLGMRIMMFEKYYAKSRLEDPKYKTDIGMIGDELADIILMVARLARLYKINLGEAYLKMLRDTMDWMGKKADF